MYTTIMPALLIIMDSWRRILPGLANASRITLPYVFILDALVNLTRSSRDASVKHATNKINKIPGTRPNTFMVAGRAMMPAPTIEVERLKTAPEKEPPVVYSGNSSGMSVSSSSAVIGRSGDCMEEISFGPWFTEEFPAFMLEFLQRNFGKLKICSVNSGFDIILVVH